MRHDLRGDGRACMSGYRGSGHPGRRVDRNPGAVDRIPQGRPDTPAQRRTARMWALSWELLRRLPEPAAFALARAAGWLAHRRSSGARARVRANMARVVPPERLDAVVYDAFQSYARYWVESFRAADLDPEVLDRRTTTAGFEHLDGVLERGRGAVVLLAHHGSWDVAARWAETHGYHLAVVAEVLRPRGVFERFVRLREAIGLEIVPLGKHRGPGRGAIGNRLGQVLADNHLVGLLTDRDLSGTAPVVELFGQRCRIPVGAAVLSRRHGAPIVPITMLQRPGRCWHLQILPPIDTSGMSISEAHQATAGALEALIRLAPAQWHAFQPVFLSDLPHSDAPGMDALGGNGPMEGGSVEARP